MKISVLGQGSIGTRHVLNVAELGHDVHSYDPRWHDPAHRTFVMDWAEAIIIATPTPQHWRDILDCCEAKKPMLIEKPITHPDRKTLELVADALATSGVPAFMGFNLRFHEGVQRAKKWTADEQPIWSSEFWVLQKNDRPEYIRDGVISNWMSHEIDLALYLLGPGRVLSCTGGDTEASIKIRHENDALSLIRGDYKTDPESRGFAISGAKTLFNADLAGTITNQHYLDELSSFIDQIQGKPGLCATWEDGVAVERIVIAARELGGLT